MATDGTRLRSRSWRFVSRAVFISLISRASLALRAWIRRRSVSIFVSPGPRVPTPPEPAPPAPPPAPPAWRERDSPQPRSRGSMYVIWASSTCALPSRDDACWAKMSRINQVRSMTLTFTISSSLRSWPGDSSPSQITVSAPVSITTSRSCLALPEPMKVAGSGLGRRCMRPSSTSAPAVSASAASSRSEFSASATSPPVHTPMSTTRSRRSWRYSTSVTSSRSVRMPATRRSAWRSSRSKPSPSISWNGVRSSSSTTAASPESGVVGAGEEVIASSTPRTGRVIPTSVTRPRAPVARLLRRSGDPQRRRQLDQLGELRSGQDLVDPRRRLRRELLRLLPPLLDRRRVRPRLGPAGELRAHLAVGPGQGRLQRVQPERSHRARVHTAPVLAHHVHHLGQPAGDVVGSGQGAPPDEQRQSRRVGLVYDPLEQLEDPLDAGLPGQRPAAPLVALTGVGTGRCTRLQNRAAGRPVLDDDLWREERERRRDDLG